MSGKHISALLVSMVVVASGSCGSASAAELRAGPMIGATSMRQIKLWVQGTGNGRVEIEYWAPDQATQIQRTEALTMSEHTDHVAQFDIGGLAPGRSYRYRVLMDGKEQKVPQTLAFKTQALWQWRGDPPDWKVALGSCNFTNETAYDRPGRPYGGPPEAKRIYQSIADQKPDLMLWTGDYLYYREVDEDSASGLRYRWRQERATPEQQPLLRSASHLAIWDDHDYGPNDSNSSYALKGEALALFKRYWANSSYGLPETPGNFGTHRFNDAEFFLLDNRTYRDSDQLRSADKTMLGERQFRWLKNALLASVSPLKIIVSGSQVSNEVNPWDGWHQFPKERAGFFEFLIAHKIDGVILISGDRHFTELLKTERVGAYPLYELTCSPLTSGVPSNLDAERANPRIVEGTFVAQRNFCTIEVGGPSASRSIVMRSFSTEGVALWEKQIALSELKTSR